MAPRCLLVFLLAAILSSAARSDVSHLLQCGENSWPWVDLWSKLLIARRELSRRGVRDQQITTLHIQTAEHGVLERFELDMEEVSFASADPLHDQHAAPDPDEVIVKTIGPYITPLAAPNISPECLAASLAYVKNILKENWATQMFDATGKMPDGILNGNVHPWGNWDQCINTTGYYNSTATEIRVLEGRYCLAFMKKNAAKEGTLEAVGLPPILPSLPIEVQATVGICIPSTCSSKELEAGLNAAFKGKVSISVQDKACYTKGTRTPLSSGATVMIVILCIVTSLMVVGTLLDVLEEYAKQCEQTSTWVRINAVAQQVLSGNLRRVVIAFSVYTNGRKLLNTKSSGDVLGCLHGIRFFSNTWVMLGHNYYFMQYFKHQNPLTALTWVNSVAFTAVDNATVSVDSFFLLSGLLVCYVFMRGLERTKGKISLVMFYVHRYIRLTPVMMLVIGFVANLYVYLGSGPWWGMAHNVPNKCIDNWWANLMYINNFVNMERQCVGQTWYLANDMQMYIFSPLILLPLYHWPILGQLWLILTLCFFTGINAIVTDVDHIGPIGGQGGGENFDYRYMKPWCRAGPYLVGLYLGWILHKVRGKRIRIAAPVVAIGWVAASLVGCLVVYGMYDYLKVTDRTLPHRTVGIVYGMLNRTAWSIALAWLIFACVTGYGGLINTFLSWKALIPLSRLTYTSYLTASAIQQFYWYSNKLPVMLDQTYVVYMFLGSLPVIFGISALFSLAFESPMIALEKIIFPQLARPPQKMPGGPAEDDKSLSKDVGPTNFNETTDEETTPKGAKTLLISAK